MKMSRSVWTFVSLVSFVFFAPLCASAQIYETIGTRAQGMGGAFVAVVDDATATWWNPAGLILTYFSLVAEGTRTDTPLDPAAGAAAWRSETKAFAASFPALGLSYYRLRLSEIAPPTSTAAAQPGRQDLGVAGGGVRFLNTHQFGATIGQSLGTHLIVASTLKLVRAGLGSSSTGTLDDAADLAAPLETSGDLDFGALVMFGTARVGVSVKHLNEPSFGDGAGAFTLKRQARAGIAFLRGQPGSIATLAAAFDADLTKTPTALGDVRHVAAGLELALPRQRLAVRGGVSANTLGEVTNSTSTSAGVSIGVLRGVYLDGARTFGTDRSRTGWAVGLRLTI
jgi:hypothetical protein